MNRSPISLTDLLQKANIRDLNPHLFSNGTNTSSEVKEAAKGKNKGQESAQAKLQALGRMKAGVMNKTEKRYFDKLTLEQQTGSLLWFAFEPLNLRLADRCFYKVDFLVLTNQHVLEVHEVKGFWTDDALVKIKVAAAKFPFRFIAVKHTKDRWETTEF